MRTIVIILFAATAMNSARAFDPAQIETITGKKPDFSAAENVYKITSPRTEIPVVVDGWTLPPFMGITSWAAFTPAKTTDAMVMGDLVLFQDEVNPVMSAALDHGLQVTALHNHFFYDNPKVFFMHIGGEGRLETLAQGVRAALDKVAEIRKAQPKPVDGFPGVIGDKNSITAAPLDAVLKIQGATKDGMYKAVFGRQVSMGDGSAMGKDMGVNTWAAFGGTDAQAVVDGDFAVHENELQTVLKSLRSAGINIVAIHSHMAGEEPRTLFLHYWGKGKAVDLATAVRQTLDAQAKIPAAAMAH